MCTEQQRHKDRSSSAKTITRRVPAAEGTALAASRAAHLLQTGHADVQDMANVSAGLPQSTHYGT